MTRRDEWLWDGNCDNCKLQKKCTKPCIAHRRKFTQQDVAKKVKETQDVFNK